MSLTIIMRAMLVAEKAHRGQTRKYSGEPYIVHPIAVAKLLAKHVGDLEVLAATVLHDTLEDTTLGEDAIKAEFGPRVLALVKEVSHVAVPADGNRATRKAIDAAHYAAASPDGKSIKLADSVDNLTSVRDNDPAFAKVYFKEAAKLLPKLAGGHPALYRMVAEIISDYERSSK